VTRILIPNNHDDEEFQKYLDEIESGTLAVVPSMVQREYDYTEEDCTSSDKFGLIVV
jgi:hypothetical protein